MNWRAYPARRRRFFILAPGCVLMQRDWTLLLVFMVMLLMCIAYPASGTATRFAQRQWPVAAGIVAHGDWSVTVHQQRAFHHFTPQLRSP